MIISQPALVCLESVLMRLLGRRVAAGVHHSGADATEAATWPAAAVSNAIAGASATQGQVEAVAVEPGNVDAESPLTAAERRARAAALRGLAFSRQRRFDVARQAFAMAARLDPHLDLTRTPTFWQLERAAHEAAIDAYVDAERVDDAAVLRARVRSTFRPKPVRPIAPQPALR